MRYNVFLVIGGGFEFRNEQRIEKETMKKKGRVV